jgi:hypothetical protein
VYLTACGVAELTPSTALVGHDGWGDGRLNNLDDSAVVLSDFKVIGELQRKKGWDIARIFVFFKIIPATAPSKGHEFPGTFYYAYNVQDNRFIEVCGLLVGDNRSPRVLLWSRVKK